MMHDIGKPFDLKKIGKEGREFSLDLSPATSQALAKACEVERVESLSGELLIRPWRKTGFSVRGEFQADIVQLCVVSLEPVSEGVQDEINRHFLPIDEMELLEKKELEEVEITLEENDPPDPLEGTSLDLFALISEQIILAKSPYPRLEGANLESRPTSSSKEEEPALKPFAALKVLKGGKKS